MFFNLNVNNEILLYFDVCVCMCVLVHERISIESSKISTQAISDLA